jgi:hypothetical protein
VYEPKEEITEPDLLNKGVTARAKVRGTKREKERLDPSMCATYKVDEHWLIVIRL